jgi:hypothetical protein
MDAPPQDAATYRPGRVVADKYRLVDAAGEGAMGTVWRAEHTSLGSTVAIKFLHGAVANAPEPRTRFEREARLAAKLGEASRHITRVTDHGVLPDGTPFLVMEFLHGEGLEVRLKRERRLPIALVAKITSQLAKALFVAHGAGVIHRDLKPANVFLCESAEDGGLLVKLLDFGVAKATLETEENQATRAGALIGTPNYMSPEQITGHGVDARSDLFGLGGIVYRMAVGKAPFGSGALSELAMRIVATEPPAPTSLAPDLPPEFDLFIKKALAKKPEERFQNARDFADSLLMVAGVSAGGSTGTFSSAAAERLALQLGDSVAGLQQTLGHSGQQLDAPPFAPKKRRAALIAGVALVIAGVGAGAVLAGRAREPESAASASPPSPSVEPTKAAAAEAKPAPPEQKADPAKVSEPARSPEPSASAGTKAGAGKVTPKVAPTAKTAATPSAADPAAAAPPPPPPPPTPPPPAQKPGDLWKKKDEM